MHSVCCRSMSIITVLYDTFRILGFLLPLHAGQKCHLVKLSPTVEYSTLALPRLQLRTLAIFPVDCSAECVRMLETLENC